MRSLRIALALLPALLLVPTARAQISNCVPPDTQGPLLYNFAMGPSLMPLGTEMQITADETLTCASDISDVTLQVDGGSPVSMFPRDGNYADPSQFEEVFYVFPLGTLGIGTHHVRMIAYDGASPPNASAPFERTVYHFGPFLAGDCRGLPEGVC